MWSHRVMKENPKKRLRVPPNSATKEERGNISSSFSTIREALKNWLLRTKSSIGAPPPPSDVPMGGLPGVTFMTPEVTFCGKGLLFKAKKGF